MTNGLNDPNISTVTGPGYAPSGGGPIVPSGDLGGKTLEEILWDLQNEQEAPVPDPSTWVPRVVGDKVVYGYVDENGSWQTMSTQAPSTGGAGALPPGVRVEPMEGQPGFVRIVAANGQTVGYQADPSFVSPAQQHTMRMNEVQSTLQFWQGQVDAGRLTSEEAWNVVMAEFRRAELTLDTAQIEETARRTREIQESQRQVAVADIGTRRGDIWLDVLKGSVPSGFQLPAMPEWAGGGQFPVHQGVTQQNLFPGPGLETLQPISPEPSVPIPQVPNIQLPGVTNIPGFGDAMAQLQQQFPDLFGAGPV